MTPVILHGNVSPERGRLVTLAKSLSSTVRILSRSALLWICNIPARFNALQLEARKRCSLNIGLLSFTCHAARLVTRSQTYGTA